MPVIASNLCQLRLAVAYLGQKGDCDWWGTDLLSATGQQLLAYNFPRQPILAGYTATCLAAKRVHDDRIGRKSTYHLFRLPGEMEAEVFAAAKARNGALLRQLDLKRQTMVDFLQQLAGECLDAPEGPIQIGNLRDATTLRGVEEMAKHYLCAVKRGTLTLPYFAPKNR